MANGNGMIENRLHAYLRERSENLCTSCMWAHLFWGMETKRRIICNRHM